MFFCVECNGGFEYVENQHYNSTYLVKIDTWRCMRCGRTVTEKRKIGEMK